MNNPFAIENAILPNVPAFPERRLATREWRDGLLVRVPNWLGDAVMALPAMWTLTSLVPKSCGSFVVCPESLQDLFEALPWIDGVIPLERTHRMWTRREMVRARSLQAGAVVLFNNSLRDAAILRLNGVPRLFGMAARCRSPLMTISFRLPTKRPDGVPGAIHHTAKYLGIARALGAPPWDGAPPTMTPWREPETAHADVAALFETNRLMIVAAGAAYGEAKRWPTESFRRVAAHWIDQGGTVAAVGSAGERDVAAAVVADLPSDKTFNVAGLTRLSDLMVIVQNAEICVANDSGVMHLTAMAGTPGVAIFGSTDPLATGPVSNHWTVLTKNLDCSPCFKRQCPTNSYLCLREITPEEVIEAVTRRLDDGENHRASHLKSSFSPLQGTMGHR